MADLLLPIATSLYKQLTNTADLVSPADGIVAKVDTVSISDLAEDYGKLVALNSKGLRKPSLNDAQRVVIYLGMTNLHFQCAPADCTLVSATHKDGQFHPAGFIDKSEFNERMILKLRVTANDGSTHEIFVVLIAGLITRRIELFPNFNVKESYAARGDKISVIKFGSRVDIIVPKVFNIAVRQGQHVQVGETVLATYSQ